MMLKKDSRNTLSKAERLSSQKLIEILFRDGKTLKHHPFIIRFFALDDEFNDNHQVLISVSKRNFKRAVDRNLLKRRIREAYRKNRHQIDLLKDKYAIAYIYSFKEMMTYSEIESKLIKSLLRLEEELKASNDK